MGKHYGHIIIEEVLALKAKGQTHREIGEALGYTYKQINELIKRKNAKQRRINAGITIKPKGRPAKDIVVTKEDKLAELRYKIVRKDYRIKQLEMENELLRDFLKETGRK